MLDAHERDLLIEVSTKLDRAIEDIKELKDDTKVRMTKMEGRIASLENWRWYVVGIASIIAMLAEIIIRKYT